MVKLIFFLLTAFLCNNCNSRKASNQNISNIKDTSSSSFDTSSNPLYWKFKSANNPIIYVPQFSLVKTDSSIINISFFDTIPETISIKMGEFYSYDTTQLAENKFIFLSTLTNYAIVKVNKRDIYVGKQYDESVSLPNDTYKDVYSGNGLTVVLTHKIIDKNNGVSNERGTLEIQNLKYKVTYKIHGGYRLP